MLALGKVLVSASIISTVVFASDKNTRRVESDHGSHEVLVPVTSHSPHHERLNYHDERSILTQVQSIKSLLDLVRNKKAEFKWPFRDLDDERLVALFMQNRGNLGTFAEEEQSLLHQPFGFIEDTEDAFTKDVLNNPALYWRILSETGEKTLRDGEEVSVPHEIRGDCAVTFRLLSGDVVRTVSVNPQVTTVGNLRDLVDPRRSWWQFEVTHHTHVLKEPERFLSEIMSTNEAESLELSVQLYEPEVWEMEIDETLKVVEYERGRAAEIVSQLNKIQEEVMSDSDFRGFWVIFNKLKAITVRREEWRVFFGFHEDGVFGDPKEYETVRKIHNTLQFSHGRSDEFSAEWRRINLIWELILRTDLQPLFAAANIDDHLVSTTSSVFVEVSQGDDELDSTKAMKIWDYLHQSWKDELESDVYGVSESFQAPAYLAALYVQAINVKLRFGVSLGEWQAFIVKNLEELLGQHDLLQEVKNDVERPKLEMWGPLSRSETFLRKYVLTGKDGEFDLPIADFYGGNCWAILARIRLKLQRAEAYGIPDPELPWPPVVKSDIKDVYVDPLKMAFKVAVLPEVN